MARQRPLSPHLQVYRLPLPALMSISHRMTGIILSSGTFLLTLYLVALANGPESFATAKIIIAHPLGQLVLFGYSVALFYHACNGVRHLFWDAVIGLTIPAVYKSGQAVLVLAALLTAGLWGLVYSLA
ncbi:MAG: succinate dehydrogenase, cytochrome b556 subunit [Alphaproteobacteria bacterium]|jgi:succinate dehydrogenase / fumarate reductase cytochrome b subunit|nr:succinate dehydrogenase, cytochrome b556 subunit [Alphaproteobacteria bacterium]MBL6776125.1 succinate dehydrogenase, cytochrome b556 subunit [Alphaproteobacteria bacterium]